MIRIRGAQSSLARHVSSGVTPEESAESREKAEREAFHNAGLVVIWIDDPKLPKTFRDMVEAVGQTRFGRRAANQQGNGR